MNRQNSTDSSEDEDGIFQDADLLFSDPPQNDGNADQRATEGNNLGDESMIRKNRRRKSLDSVASSDNNFIPEDGGSRSLEPEDLTSTQVLDAEAFLTPTILDVESMQRARERVEKGLVEPMKKLKSTDGGVQSYLEWLAKANNMTNRSRQQETSHRERLAKLMADATIQGSPRDYQRILLEMAKQENTIVHLGTGYGKTLIALLLIKEKSKDWDMYDDKKKQTLFLVPSVALAIQQSMTLRANLPFSVGELLE
jgi:primosomal protein N'